MTRAQTIDVLNDSTTLQSRIDTVLATPDLDWTNDSGWHPGDPLHEHPWASADPEAQYVREMVEVINAPEPYARCKDCEVSWTGDDACWICGADCPRSSFGMRLGDFVLDESYGWGAAMAEAMRPFIEQMSRMAEQFEEMSRRVHFTIVAEQICGFTELDPEPVNGIHFPAGTKITPVVDHQPPAVTLAPVRPDLYRPQAERFRLNRPATETRRPRRTL